MRSPGRGRRGNRPDAGGPSAHRRSAGARPSVSLAWDLRSAVRAGSALLRRAEHQVGDGPAVAPLAFALQPVPPGGAYVVFGPVHLAEPDIGHPLAGSPGVEVVEVGAGLSLGTP